MREATRAIAVGLPLVLGLLIAPGTGRVAAQGEGSSIGSRITTLEERAERAGASDLLAHARRALLEVDRRRARGEMAAAERAESIAEAAVRAAERRVEAHRARGDLEAARARLVEIERRAETARAALERAHAERARVARAEDPEAPSEGEERASEEEE